MFFLYFPLTENKQKVVCVFQVILFMTLSTESLMTFVITAVHVSSFDHVFIISISFVWALKPNQALYFHYHWLGWEPWQSSVLLNFIISLNLYLRFDRSPVCISNICDIAYIDLTKNIYGAMGLHVIASISLAVACDFHSNILSFVFHQTQFSNLASAANETGYSAYFASITENYTRSDLTLWEHCLSHLPRAGAKLFHNGLERCKLDLYFSCG